MSIDRYEQIWKRGDNAVEERTLAEANQMFAWIEELDDAPMSKETDDEQ